MEVITHEIKTAGAPCNVRVLSINSKLIALADMSPVVGGMSVTNAAEEVVDWCHEWYPGRVVSYRDTDKEWWILESADGQFTGFRKTSAEELIRER